MITVTRHDFEPSSVAASPEIAGGQMTYSMTALLSLAVQRETDEHQLQVHPTDYSLVRWAAVAIIVSALAIGLAAIVRSPHLDRQWRQRPAVSRDLTASSTVVIVSSVEPHIRKKAYSVPFASPRPLIRSKIERVAISATSRLQPSVPPISDHLHMRTAHQSNAVFDEPEAPDQTLSSNDGKRVSSDSIENTSIDIKTVGVQHSEFVKRSREIDRLAAIDAIRALRSR